MILQNYSILMENNRKFLLTNNIDFNSVYGVLMNDWSYIVTGFNTNASPIARE